jgi:hypothetical protein
VLKRSLIAVIGILGIILAVMVFQLEPRYHGRRISYWLGMDHFGEWDAKVQAIHSAGTDAVPFILQKLRAKSSSKIVANAPRSMQGFLPGPSMDYREAEAAYDLAQTGPAVIPILIQALQDENPSVRAAAVLALRFLERPGSDDVTAAMPSLIHALGDKDAWVRYWAASALGEMKGDLRPAVPSLIALLRDPEIGRNGRKVYVRCAAAEALGNIGPAATAAMMELKNLRSDPDPATRQAAAIAIWRMDRDEAGALPFLGELPDTRMGHSYANSFAELGRMPYGYATLLESTIVLPGADPKTDRVRTGYAPWIRIELKSL